MMEKLKRRVGFQGSEEGRNEYMEHRRLLRSETSLYNTIMVDRCIIYLSKAIECTTVNPNVNYRLQVIMISQCGFIKCNKCATLGCVNNGRGCA